jgi:polyferredoxin
MSNITTDFAAERRRQAWRLLAQGAFFTVFVLTPIFDLFRYDLTLGHAYLLGFEWHLGIDDFLAGRIGAGHAALNIALGLFGPALGFAALGLGIAWKWGRLYCGWLCPHFSVVETVNRLMIVATGKHSLWDPRALPAVNPDGSPARRDRRAWALLVPIAIGFALNRAVVLLTYLLPPLDLYPRLFAFDLTRNEMLFLGAATTVLTLEFLFARHLFCRYACAVGMFQSLAWMGNRKALVVGVERDRLTECADCLNGEGAACEAVCPMRLKPRNIKRLMFACTQCAQCVSACSTVNRDNPQGSLLHWVQGEAAKQNEAGFKSAQIIRMHRKGTAEATVPARIPGPSATRGEGSADSMVKGL